MKKHILTALCFLALAYIGKIVYGVIDMARYQEVPVAASAFEIAVLLIAVFFPLVASLRPNKEKKTWHYIVWTPCILYVVAITINYLIRVPASPEAYSSGLLRLVVWIAIAFLFIRHLPQKENA
jgi:hypothetical protein